eukprot:scaffold5658_cov76-Phaeocystis_antarctica.AAC.1
MTRLTGRGPENCMLFETEYPAAPGLHDRYLRKNEPVRPGIDRGRLRRKTSAPPPLFRRGRSAPWFAFL